MKCLLVEPEYKTKYPNLALMKISTKLKQDVHYVEYFHGMKHRTLDNPQGYDEIYIATLFTYEAPITIKTINFYKRTYPSAEIFVGGILATLMPKYIKEKTGIDAFIGYSKELDMLKPDYDLIKMGTHADEFSYVFTSRGCPNRCPFCAVPKLEPEVWINPNWKKTIDFRRLKIVIQDNNLTATSIEHFKDVMQFLRKFGLKAIYDSGLDCRLLNEEHVKALKKTFIHERGLRMSFDGLHENGHIQRAINLCLEHGITEHKMMIYVLFNFNDTPQEAEWRMREIVDLGIEVYPQRYIPLTKLTRNPKFVGKYWTNELATAFRQYYQLQRTTTYRKYTFPEWLKMRSKHELLEQFNKYPFESLRDNAIQK